MTPAFRAFVVGTTYQQLEQLKIEEEIDQSIAIKVAEADPELARVRFAFEQFMQSLKRYFLVKKINLSRRRNKKHASR